MEPFKNLLNEKAARKIGQAVLRSYSGFDSDRFLEGLARQLEPLELKDRMLLLTSRLELALPRQPEKSFPILLKALKKNPSDKVGLSGFLAWPLTQYVAKQGLEHFELSMNALYHMTQVFTAEFAIRPFLMHDEERTLKQLLKWTKDPSEHVRRLASEGSRPLLPWGQKLPSFIRDPDKTWPLLENLRHDDSKYVQKSVANHINDHSKNHGDWVVQKLRTWSTEGNAPLTLDWIIRHSTRTLVKQCHSGALELHGIRPVSLKIIKPEILNPEIRLGQTLKVRLILYNQTQSEVKIMADQELLLLKSNGQHAPKVFKGKKISLAANEKRELIFQIPIKKITTRRYYAGKQGWTLLLNGSRQKTLWFQLK